MNLPPKFARAKPPRLSVAEIKALVRFRDGYRCRLCGMTARKHIKRFRHTLDVHRLVPGSKYTVKGCIAVCRPCHKTLPKSPKHHGTSCPGVPDRIEFHAPLGWKSAIDAASLASGVKPNAFIRAAILEFLKAKSLKTP